MSDTTPYANSVFEQPWWLDIVAPGKWGEVFVKEGDEVIARMPYVLDHGSIKMPHDTQTLGPWIKPEYRAYQPGNTQLSKQKEIISELLAQLPKHKSFNMRFDSSNEYILPYRWLGYRYVPSFSYRIKDLSNLDAIYANFNKTAKKNIRRAEKVVLISNEPNAEVLIDIMEKTFAGQGRKYPGDKGQVRTIVDKSIAHDCGRMFTAIDKDGHIHASSFLLFDANCAYALMGGADPDYRGSGAKSVVWQNEIEFATGHSKAFDFEGSNIEGIENFVRQFGGERVINYSVIKQSLLADCWEMAKPRIKRLIGYKI